MEFKEAKRENIAAKVLTIASSGGGKTYSNLILATGFAKELSKETGSNEKIAVINSEANRGTIYANEFKYDILDITAPYTPEKYVSAINAAIKAGYKVLIIDSLTHEWSGKGGCLEIHSKIPGNTYTAWSSVTPRHEALMDAILDSNIHIFCTVRGDDKYELQEINGKKVPVKIPVGYDQRKKIEYQFMVSLMLDLDTHLATAMKDNTHIFENKVEILTEEDGRQICRWALGADLAEAKKLADERRQIQDELNSELENEAKGLSSKSKQEVKDNEKKELFSIESASLAEIKVELLNIAKAKGKTDDRQKVIDILHDYKGNPANIKEIESAKTIYNQLSAL